MLSQSFLVSKSKNFTSSSTIGIPPTVPVNPSQTHVPTKRAQTPKCYSVRVVRAKARDERFDLFTVTRRRWIPSHLAVERTASGWEPPGRPEPCGPGSQEKETPTSSTTSFLTATNLMFLRRAGITAAAGTRLALDLILGKGFKLSSFQ
jgi:hypothetical protein